MRLFEIFRDLLVFGDDIGKVESAHMYDNYCSIDGIDKNGNKFTLSMSFKRNHDCENINEEVKIDDSI